MSIKVGILDYGVGNIRSVFNAVAKVGAEPVMLSDPKLVDGYSHIIAPGVGSFGYVIERFTEQGFTDVVNRYLEKDRYYLGICVGMQMLFEESEESPDVRGLGVLQGGVRKMQTTDSESQYQLKLPFIGWSSLQVNPDRSDSVLLKGLDPDARFYFVHSYCAVPTSADQLIADTEYGDNNIASLVGKNNVFGTQFHPERSGEYGLKLLANFCQQN